jgi:GDP-L-fucose synthase
MKRDSKIFVAGHRGLVGASIVDELKKQGYTNLLLETRATLDLTDQLAVNKFFESQRPEYVFLAAAKVGGILANSTNQAQFIYENLMIEANVLHHSYLTGVKKLLFLGSSCIYPKFAKQPIQESELLGGYLEPSNDAYAIAKIAGIKMCMAYNNQFQTNFLSLMPTNLYGPRDNCDLLNSHVLPALMRKIHEAKIAGNKEVVIWGSGSPRREFLFSEDLARACIFFMEKVSAQECNGPINVGVGEDVTIRELAELLAKEIGYTGKFVYDSTKPDGTPRKLLDVSKQRRFGWSPKVSLPDGIRLTYEWYLKQNN